MLQSKTREENEEKKSEEKEERKGEGKEGRKEQRKGGFYDSMPTPCALQHWRKM